MKRIHVAVLPLLLLLPGCGEPLMDVIRVADEKDANEILVALRELDPRKVSTKSGQTTMYSIQVRSADFQTALSALIARNLPRNRYGGFEAMLDSAGLIPTRTDERAKFLHAKEQELEGSLELIDGVLHARVHIAVPEKDRYASVALSSAPPKPKSGAAADAARADADAPQAVTAASSADHRPSASVVLRYHPDKLDLTPAGRDAAILERIPRIVANAIEDLDAARVEVFAQPARVEVTPLPLAAADAAQVAPLADDERARLEGELAALRGDVGDLTSKRNYAIIASLLLAILLLFALIRSVKRR